MTDNYALVLEDGGAAAEPWSDERFETLHPLPAGGWVMTGGLNSSNGRFHGIPFKTDEDEMVRGAEIAADGGVATYYSYRHGRTGDELIVRVSRTVPFGPWEMNGFKLLELFEDTWVSTRVPMPIATVHRAVRAPDRVTLPW